MSAAEPTTKFDFMKYRFFWLSISLLQVLVCVYIWMQTGMQKYSIDFLGGTDLVLKFNQPIDAGEIRGNLEKAGINGVIVQQFDNNSSEYSIRFKGTSESNLTKKILESLNTIGGGNTVLKNDFVGPIIGDKIKKDGFKAVTISIIGLLIYIAWRFEWVYGLGAIIAVFHDVFISAGLFLLTGGEIGSGALAALLTILGYSVNDTIVTYDRIRENLLIKAKPRSDAKIGSINLKDLSLYDIINISVNQTLSRTILTGGTTLFTCLALAFIGGGDIAELSIVLAIGIVVGTYSSIFVASPLVLAFNKKK